MSYDHRSRPGHHNPWPLAGTPFVRPSTWYIGLGAALAVFFILAAVVLL